MEQGLRRKEEQVKGSERRQLEAVPSTLELIFCSMGGEGREGHCRRGSFHLKVAAWAMILAWFLFDAAALGRAGAAVGSGWLGQCFLPGHPGSFRNPAI